MSNFSQFSQPQPLYYNLSDMASQTQTFRLHYNLGQQLDAITPQVALMVANEVQAQARRNNHPLRVNMHDYISENAYQNEQFRALVYVVMMRIGFGMENREWANLNAAAQQTISMLCKAYAGGLAASNPGFMAALAQSDPDAVAEAQRQANDWQYFQALADGTVAYVPFQQGQQFSAITRSVQQPTVQPAGAGNQTNVSGAFTEQPVFRPNSEGDNFANAAPTRYERMLQNAQAAAQQAQGQVQGQWSNQAAMNQPGPQVAQNHSHGNAGFGTRAAVAALAQKANASVTDVEVVKAQGADAAKAFDANLQHQADAGAQPMAKVRLNGVDVLLMQMISYADGIKRWKTIDIQPYLPVYCKRTHRLLFFVTSDNQVIGVIQSLQIKEKAATMNYEAHRIIPGMGTPDPTAPTVPVREEAKVLYADAGKVNMIIVTGSVTMTESLENAVKVAQNIGRRGDDDKNVKRDVSLTGAIVNTVFSFGDKMIRDDQLSLVAAAARSKSLGEAGDIIARIDDSHLRRTIESSIAADINAVLAIELGLPKVVVSGAINTYAADLLELLTQRGTLVLEKYESRIPSLLQANLKFTAAEEAQDYSSYFLAVGDENEAPTDVIERSAILQRNVNIARLSYSEDELALEIPLGTAAVIEKQAVPVAYGVAKALQSDKAALSQAMQPDNYVLTSDGFLFKIHRGLLAGSDLISKVAGY